MDLGAAEEQQHAGGQRPAQIEHVMVGKKVRIDGSTQPNGQGERRESCQPDFHQPPSLHDVAGNGGVHESAVKRDRSRTVPLYSGFMYASVASYIMQAWRLMKVRLTAFPPFPLAVGLCAAIYANFFTNHYMLDLRWPLAACVLLLFRRTQVHFTVTTTARRMPLALSFLLIGFFIWVAENIATYFGAWQYPHQKRQWAIVGPTKISSWMLLVIISFIIVAALKEIFPKQQEVFSAGDEALQAQIGEANTEDKPALV